MEIVFLFMAVFGFQMPEVYIGWNILLFVAFVFRIADKFLNKNIPFSIHSCNKEAFQNFKTECYAFLCMILALGISLFKRFPADWNEWSLIVLYLTIGFGSNYFFSKAIEWGTLLLENIFKPNLNKKNDEKI